MTKEFVRLVIHPPTAKICDCWFVDGWNSRLTRLSSHTKRVRYGVGIPVCLANKPDRPDVTKLRDEIRQLERLNDPDLKSAIAKKTDRLNELLLVDSVDTVSDKMRQDFINIFTSGDLVYLNENEKRSIYRDWIREIRVDRNEIEIVLAI